MTDKQFEQIECLSKKLWGDINNGHEYSMVTYTEFLGIVTEVWEKLQEEPVSIWHDSSEMPKEKKVCLIRYSANGGASTNNFEVVIAEPLTRRFVTRSYPHKTGYQHSIHGENTIKVDEYQDRREYIPFSDIDEWAYIDDLLNLSNVQRTVKDWKEPVSKDLEEASKNYALNNTPWDDCKDEIQESFKAGAKWQKEKEYTCYEEAFEDGAKWQKEKDESVTKDLGEYINELSKQFPEVSFAKLSRIAVRVAKWQKENLWKPADSDDLPEIDKEVVVLIQPYPLENSEYAVSFAHRPNPNGWDGKSITTGKVEHYTPKTYDKGGWNIPDVKYWLDVELPKEIEL